jgi:hypothetical protein
MKGVPYREGVGSLMHGVSITSSYMHNPGRVHWEVVRRIFRYYTFPIKSTGGVTRNLFYLFDISAAAEFLRDTSKFSAFERMFSFCLHFLGRLGDAYFECTFV